MAVPSSVPAWRIPWTEEPGGLQSMGSQRDRTEQLTVLFKVRRPICSVGIAWYQHGNSEGVEMGQADHLENEGLIAGSIVSR